MMGFKTLSVLCFVVAMTLLTGSTEGKSISQLESNAGEKLNTQSVLNLEGCNRLGEL